MNAAKGKATEEEFNARYGTGKALFLQCDVRSAEQLAGNHGNKYQLSIAKLDLSLERIHLIPCSDVNQN